MRETMNRNRSDSSSSSSSPSSSYNTRIAIEGCCHGELDQIYDAVKKANENELEQSKIDNRPTR